MLSSRRRIAGLIGVIAVVVGACGTTASPSPSSAQTSGAPATAAAASSSAAAAKPVTIEWWHITTGDPGKTVFQNAADAYHAAHPNVTINITILENEAFKAKLQTTMQSGQVPDLFQSWGGGGMADQVDAGLLKDLTTDVAPWKDELNPGAMSIYQYKGKQYGIPWDLGMIGVWYNKDLFSKAGITASPPTWDEFLADVDKLKAAKVVPFAIAGKDEWPGMHLWTYLVLRIGGSDALTQMVQSGDWNTDACKAGGAEAKKFVDKQPFQPGFLNAVYDKGEAATMGNGQAAMELMGQWAPATQIQNSTSGKGIGDKLAWFPFPTVAGGAGAPTDAVGGGNGIAVGKNAPAEALDFLHYFVSKDVATKVGSAGFGIPVTVGTESSVTDPFLKDVLANRAKATFVQLYLDQATSANMGKAINDATAGLFAGKSTPEQVCQEITDAAANQ
jgi:raffinose/stachyose/melibiose transport system substrate-binding protein